MKHTAVGFMLCLALGGLTLAATRAYRHANMPLHAVAPLTFAPLRGQTVTLVNAQIDGQTAPLLLNLGQHRSYLYDDFVQTHALRAVEQSHEVEAQTQVGTYAQAHHFEVLRGGPGAAGNNHVGALGSDFFEEQPARPGARVTLNLRAKTLTIDTTPLRPRLAPHAGAEILPWRQAAFRDEWTLPVRAGGLALALALDTSASATILPWQAAKHILPASQIKNPPPRVTANLTLGARTLRLNCDTFPTAPEWGVLGLDIAANQNLILDYHENQMAIEP